MRYLIYGIFLSVLVGVTPSISHANYEEELVRDFSPLQGYVIMPVGDQFLIDLDGTKGLQLGDLIAVISEGNQIIHPVTKKNLGRLTTTKAVLKVSAVKSNYSYADVINKVEAISAGDKIVRYQNLSASFVDPSGKGEPTYRKLKELLPQLEWANYAANPIQNIEQNSTDIIFTLNDNQLAALDSTHTVIKSYNLTTSNSSDPIQNKVITGLPMAPSFIEENPAEISQSAIILKKTEKNNQSIQEIFKSSAMPVGIEVNDFDNDGLNETAIAFADHVLFGRYKNKAWEEIQNVEIPNGVRILNIDSMDLDHDGQHEIYLTASGLNGTLRSQIIRLQQGKYQVTQTGIEMYFRAVTLPGRDKVLLGQRVGQGENVFSGSVFEVQSDKNSVREGNLVPLPAGISLYGFAPIKKAKSDIDYIYIDQYSKIHIKSKDGQSLIDGEKGFGGSLAYIERMDMQVLRDPLANTQKTFLQARIEIGPNGEILIPANHGSSFSSQLRSYKKSQLHAYRWDGENLTELWHTANQNMYLADFRYADIDNDGQAEIVMALGSGSSMFNKQKGAIKVFEF